MKTKQFNKKLVLNKNTIVNLDSKALENLKGGITGWCSDRHSWCDGVSFCGSEDPCHTVFDPYNCGP